MVSLKPGSPPGSDQELEQAGTNGQQGLGHDGTRAGQATHQGGTGFLAGGQGADEQAAARNLNRYSRPTVHAAHHRRGQVHWGFGQVQGGDAWAGNTRT